MINITTNERTYITGKIKDVTILNRKRKVLSFIITMRIIIEDTKGIIIKNYKQQNPTATKERETPTAFNKNIAPREPLKCWECGEPHYSKDCPIRKKNCNHVHSIQKVVTVGDMVRSMPRINLALENRQENHQTSMVEIEGMIKSHPISILIDPCASLSYVSPRIVEMCKL